jgi:hypothetical protein
MLRGRTFRGIASKDALRLKSLTNFPPGPWPSEVLDAPCRKSLVGTSAHGLLFFDLLLDFLHV